MTTNEWLIVIFSILCFVCGYNIGKVAGMKDVLRTALSLTDNKKKEKKDAN